MTNEITPPPELVLQWCHEDGDEIKTSPRWFRSVCAKAARWGADQELEACCADLRISLGPNEAEWLRSVRRPKMPSLKKLAYHALDTYIYGNPDPKDKEYTYNAIRRALESLPD